MSPHAWGVPGLNRLPCAVQQIHEDLRVQLFADHVRALTEISDSKITDEGSQKFNNFKGTCAVQELTDVTHGKPRRTDPQQASRGFPKMTTNWAEQILTNCSSSLTEVFRAFLQLKDKFHDLAHRGTTCLPESWRLSTKMISHQVAEAISKAISTLLGSRPRLPSN
jgi:hypothetical protein